jgi:hypothetical protein
MSYINKQNYGGDLSTTRSLLKGTKAKPFTYPSFDSRPIAIVLIKGKRLLLDFWETWCGLVLGNAQDQKTV